jgi:hypothetical protein
VKALDIFGLSGDGRGTAYVMKGIGDVNAQQGFSDEAMACYRDAHTYFSQRNILYGLSIVSTALVKVR